MRILDSIGNILNQKSSVQMVADNSRTASEILLLIRTMFADGEMKSEELDMFKRLCQSLFNIPPEDVPEVIKYLKDVGYETDSEQAASIFDDRPAERKQELMTHLVMMAMADNELHEKEKAVLQRVAVVLGYSERQIAEMF